MASPARLERGTFSELRKIDGAPVVADATDLSTMPRVGLLNSYGWSKIFVHVQLAGGTSPSVGLQPLFYDAEIDDFAVGAAVAFADGEIREIAVGECRIWLRLDSVAGLPTQVQIRIAPSLASGLG